MKKTNLSLIAVAAATIMMVGCSTLNNSSKGALIGTGGGAVLGAGIGALIGGKQGAAIGAAAGAAVGAGTGTLIGKKMDKQAAELAKIEGAKVETITDVNGFQAIKVTFESGILFATNKSELSVASKEALAKFATSLKETPDTDVTIYGHTDNTGALEYNQKLSLTRAQTVANYLEKNGIAKSRIINIKGLDFQQPVASNDTADGRLQNRRVEIYITANKTMVEKANAGTLK